MHAIGLVKQSMPIRKADRSDFAMTLYVKKGSRDYLTQTLNGSSTTVPEGMILRAKTSILKNEVVLFHFHPNDNTKLPGVDDELECRITGLLESQ
ncbi:MAG: hypothetical protein M9962_03720 [Oligoflexia bacterium]|nr:hypothetical protein [Oligoflexia bacterium]